MAKKCWIYRKGNRIIGMRSSWEVKAAEYFDTMGWEWKYEPRKFNLLHGMTLTIDFYVKTIKTWIEIKGYPRSDARFKIDEFKRIYSKLTIEVWDKQILLQKGIL